jgi:post-segregation antitoxin (ccd killing protein)
MARPSSRTQSVPLSLEASLDEENREVLAALDRQRPRSPATRPTARTDTPPPTLRSMLDVDASPSTPRHGSIAGIGVGVTSPRQHRKESTADSRLDPSDPSTWTTPHSSKPNSPTLTRTEVKDARPRGGSDASPTTSGYVGLPRVQQGANRSFEHDFQFDMSSIPTSGGTSTKQSADPTKKREGSGSSAMVAALSGDLSNLHVGRPLAASRSHGSGDSRSPSGRINSPSSPSRALLSPTSPPGKLTTAHGTVVDEHAHRRLSNKSNSFSTVTDDSEEGAGRLPTDKPPFDHVVESSDEDGDSAGSDDEQRGRDRDPKSTEVVDSPATDSAKTDETDSRTTSPTEQKKHTIPHSQIIKSMLEPSISVIGPGGEKLSQPYSGVHPQSNFDKRRLSMSATSVDDEGDDDAIAKAKSLGLNISPLDTKVLDRHVRMIIRGEWVKLNNEAKAGDRNVRTYLLCSDLSVEATYALEWTVGTIMRDGDTLLAIYAIEDESAGSPSKDSKQTEAEKEMLHQEGAQAGKAANDTMAQLTRQATNQSRDEVQSTFIPATELQSLTGSVDARKVGKKEMDRLKAIDDITQSFLRLVRKTTLQVRAMIEVIHCKSPKHLILGAVRTHTSGTDAPC